MTTELHAELRGMIESASRWADKRFIEYGMLSPIWHAVTASGKEVCFDEPHPNKDLAVMLVRAVFERIGVVRCLFIDEAWCAEGTQADAELMDREGVRVMPNHIEAVVFIGEDQHGGMLAQRKIERPGHGIKAYLGPLEFMDIPDERGGRLTHMLPPRAKAQA